MNKDMILNHMGEFRMLTTDFNPKSAVLECNGIPTPTLLKKKQEEILSLGWIEDRLEVSLSIWVVPLP